MTIEVALLISVVTGAAGIYFGMKSSKKADTEEIAKKAADSATINAKLDSIIGDTREIKNDMKRVNREVQTLTERMIIVEQSTKSAHKRLDQIAGKDPREGMVKQS